MDTVDAKFKNKTNDCEHYLSDDCMHISKLK